MAHDCTGNTHVSINDNNFLVCHASIDIKKGEPIDFNYTDPLKVSSTILLNKKYDDKERSLQDKLTFVIHLLSLLQG